MRDFSPHATISVVSPSTGEFAPFAIELDVRHMPAGVWFGPSGKEPFVGQLAIVKL